mmetsp:Transcript_17386/g.44163  ORF Transcript_17386/g.44163 Transcript_17386/m.44163 type:complete len:241 (-) Transcript_17386:1342-2064(-)
MSIPGSLTPQIILGSSMSTSSTRRRTALRRGLCLTWRCLWISRRPMLTPRGPRACSSTLCASATSTGTPRRSTLWRAETVCPRRRGTGPGTCLWRRRSGGCLRGTSWTLRVWCRARRTSARPSATAGVWGPAVSATATTAPTPPSPTPSACPRPGARPCAWPTRRTTRCSTPRPTMSAWGLTCTRRRTCASCLRTRAWLLRQWLQRPRRRLQWVPIRSLSVITSVSPDCLADSTGTPSSR